MIAAAFREDWPLLIICPSTLRLDWESALHTWLPPPILRHVVTIMSGSVSDPLNWAVLAA